MPTQVKELGEFKSCSEKYKYKKMIINPIIFYQISLTILYFIIKMLKFQDYF